MGNRLNRSRENGKPLARPVVFLARHATPDWNRKDIRYDVAPGPPLVPEGEEEARTLGSYFRTSGVHSIVASPLVRTLHTAELAGEVAGAAVRVEAGVAEYRREENDDAVFARYNDVFEQVWTEAEKTGPVAIISHGGPVRVMLERFGIAAEHIWHYRRQFDHQNPLPPAGAWEITRVDDRWQANLVFAPQAFTAYTPTIVYV